MGEAGKRRHKIHIRKEALKFASAHMTVFPDGTKEALHGHGYSTDLTVEVKSIELEDLISFDVFKKTLKTLCDRWDEKVLLPEKCPHLKVIERKGKSTEFELCKKRYVIPSDEVEWIPADNITTESLADVLMSELIEALKKQQVLKAVHSLELRVDESPGQGASCRWKCKHE